ncbi:Receptor-like serine/threonine-protein kinase [Arachis hypogaea]|nr:Receptor-like serine/threonine-protein kinase [Arachis hypogaea]
MHALPLVLLVLRVHMIAAGRLADSLFSSPDVPHRFEFAERNAGVSFFLLVLLNCYYLAQVFFSLNFFLRHWCCFEFGCCSSACWRALLDDLKSVSVSVSYVSSERAKTWLVNLLLDHLLHLDLLPLYLHHLHHIKVLLCIQVQNIAIIIITIIALRPICTDPLTSTPFGSPCGCVFPMKVRLTLGVAPYAVFPVMNELEIEVALGTYLEQSQVKIMGASADSENQGRTVVDINLSLFGDYDVLYIAIQTEALGFRNFFIATVCIWNHSWGCSYGSVTGSLPVSANFVNKNQRMNLRTIIIIASSSFVLLLVLVGAVSIILKCQKIRRPSSAVGPAFTSSLNKRSGLGSMLSSSITSSTSVSLCPQWLLPFSLLNISLSELEKATDKFIYSGTLEDGAEVAVKLLTRDNQNGDREFIAEVEMLSRLHHRNLVKLLGICIEGRRRAWCMSLFTMAVLSHICMVLTRKGTSRLGSTNEIALGAARGLAYLHEDSNPRVIHRDFKASNVLLEDDFTPKVSDFGLAREATEGSQHISTRVMGTFGKPVDMSQPQGQENLVTWARPLLASREGLEQLVDPSLAGSYDFDDMAKVAAIASMCVHPEVTQRPFMGEVVQALKLIYNDADETCGDYCSQKDSSVQDSDFRGDLAPSDSRWWNAGGLTPRLTYGQASSFITMEYSSGPLDDMETDRFDFKLDRR